MINLNPTIWGPHAWFFIESIAISLPDSIPLETQNELKHFFISISFLLPCETCRNHFSEYVKKTDLMNIDFSTKTKVLIWINNIHNEVRKRNKCKNIPIDKTIKYYNEKYNIETKNSYLDLFLIGIFIIGLILVIKYIYFSKPIEAQVFVPSITQGFAPSMVLADQINPLNQINPLSQINPLNPVVSFGPNIV